MEVLHRYYSEQHFLFLLLQSSWNILKKTVEFEFLSVCPPMYCTSRMGRLVWWCGQIPTFIIAEEFASFSPGDEREIFCFICRDSLDKKSHIERYVGPTRDTVSVGPTRDEYSQSSTIKRWIKLKFALPLCITVNWVCLTSLFLAYFCVLVDFLRMPGRYSNYELQRSLVDSFGLSWLTLLYWLGVFWPKWDF